MVLDFGPVNDPDLKTYSTALIAALTHYTNVLNQGVKTGAPLVGFSDISPFQSVEGRPYTAKTKIPLTLSGQPAAKLAVILLRPGEGTGDRNTYSYPLSIPKGITGNPWNEAVIPRGYKHDLEIALPLFSAAGNYAGLGVGSVLELTVDRPLEHPMHPTEVQVLKSLGDIRTFMDAAGKSRDTNPRAYLTIDMLSHTPFGNPHAVYYPEMLAITASAVGQVWGFVQTTRGEPIHDRLMPLVESTRTLEERLRSERRRDYDDHVTAQKTAQVAPQGVV